MHESLYLLAFFLATILPLLILMWYFHDYCGESDCPATAMFMLFIYMFIFPIFWPVVGLYVLGLQFLLGGL